MDRGWPNEFFVTVNMDKRSMEARLRVRERARRLYDLAAETTAVLAARKYSGAPPRSE
jgi:hypothetical protein